MSLVPGKLYLRLYHGRNDPEQQMDEWDLSARHSAHSPATSTRIAALSVFMVNDTSELWLNTHDDMIRWDGCFYGDMEAFIAGIDDKA